MQYSLLLQYSLFSPHKSTRTLCFVLHPPPPKQFYVLYLGFICLESLLLLLQAQNLRFAMTQNSHLSSDLPQPNLSAKKTAVLSSKNMVEVMESWFLKLLQLFSPSTKISSAKNISPKKMVEMMMESRFLKMFQLFFFPSIKLTFAKKEKKTSAHQRWWKWNHDSWLKCSSFFSPTTKSFCKNPQLKDGGNGNSHSSNALEVLISHKKSYFLPKKTSDSPR